MALNEQQEQLCDSSRWDYCDRKGSARRCSVALVPADALDVVPCCHVVARMTVADFCVRLASHWAAYPSEVWRAMARGGTMALCAVG